MRLDQIPRPSRVDPGEWDKMIRMLKDFIEPKGDGKRSALGRAYLDWLAKGMLPPYGRPPKEDST